MRNWLLGLTMAMTMTAAVSADEPAKSSPSQGNYVVIVGVGETADKTIKPRESAVNDAKALYDFLADKKYFDVAKDRIVLLTDQADEKRNGRVASRNNVIAAVKDAVSKTGKDDTLIVAFFGRGATSGDRTCLFAADSTFKNRGKDSILGADLEAEFKQLKQQKFAMILDAHFKGYDAGSESVVEPSFRDLISGVFGSEEKSEGAANHDRLLVFSMPPSADPIIKPDTKNNTFTLTLIDAMAGKADNEGGEADGLVTIDEVVKYVEKICSETAQKSTAKNEKEAVPIVARERATHFAITRNPDKTQEVAKLVSRVESLNLSAEQFKEAKKFLTLMPKLKKLQEIRKLYQQLATDKISLDELNKQVKSIRDSMILTEKAAREYASKVNEAIDLVGQEYVKKSNAGDLTAAGIRGIYRRSEEPIPSEMEAELKNLKDASFTTRTDLLVKARLALGLREDLDDNKDADVTILYMLFSLNDPYTTYFDKESIKKIESQLKGEFRGVGIQIRRDLVKDALLVVSPIKGSPAYKAGIQAGDYIIGVKRATDPQGKPLKEGEPTEISTKGMKTEKALDLILGKIGVPVTLVMERDGKQFDKELVRDRINVETVFGVKRDEKDEWSYYIDEKEQIAYIRLSQFGPTSAADLEKALVKTKEQGLKGLILDLRGNPGGLLNAAIGISSLFVQDGKVVSVRNRAGREQSYRTQRLNKKFTDIPMAVLVNGYSASASEIVSACLKDHNRAVVIGERSYGKGSVQQIVPFDATDGQIKLTTAKYFPPSGDNIDKLSKSEDKPDEWGVKPSDGFEVKISKEELQDLEELLREHEIIRPKGYKPEKPAKAFDDKQKTKALEYIREQIKAAQKVER